MSRGLVGGVLGRIGVVRLAAAVAGMVAPAAAFAQPSDERAERERRGPAAAHAGWEELPRTTAAGGRETLEQLPAHMREACPPNKWVGYVLTPRATCAAPGPARGGRWVLSRPFADSADRELVRYCVYDFVPAPGVSPARADVSALPNVRWMRLERDCDVVAPLAGDPEAAHAEKAAGYAAQLGLGDNWMIPDDLANVRVAIIDSGVENHQDGPAVDRSNHAQTTGAVVQSIACRKGPGPGCAARLTNHLALPRVTRYELDEVRGGYYGSLLEAGLAMYDAIDRFLDEGTDERLVMNMSFGWDEQWGGRLPTTTRLPARLVHEVARYAACHGALLVAAAGNRNAPDFDGPMFPAAWEREPAECGPASVTTYRPLVHAAGGVDGADRILGTARPGAAPRLQAPAMQAAVYALENGNDKHRTHALTGTSMAAAAASGTAALVWGLRPDLAPADVMELVYSSGTELERDAAFGLVDPPLVQRRLSVCGAVRAACAKGEALCPPSIDALVPCPERPAGNDPGPDWDVVLDLVYPAGDPITTVETEPFQPEANLADECVQPYAIPQPGTTTCPECGVDSQGNFKGKIALKPGYTWIKANVVLNGKHNVGGTFQIAFTITQQTLGGPDMLAGKAFSIKVPNFSPGTQVITNGTMDLFTWTGDRTAVTGCALFGAN